MYKGDNDSIEAIFNWVYQFLGFGGRMEDVILGDVTKKGFGCNLNCSPTTLLYYAQSCCMR